MPGTHGNVRLSFAIGNYEHVRDFMDGIVCAEGIDTVALDLPIEEIFWRFLHDEEFDVAELSLGMYTSLVSRGSSPYIAIPVFPSKMFRHSAIFVHADSDIATLEELRGKRVGLAQWSQTAATFVRGMLVEQAGLDLAGIDWYQAGVNEAGRTDPAVLKLPSSIRLTPMPDRSLDAMLANGELDAVISARPPRSSSGPTPRIRRLFEDYVPLERSYFAETGIFPIMHVIAIRRAVYDANPWIARNIFAALDRSRARSTERIADETASRIAVPWLRAHIAQTAAVLGPDPYAYGIEANRTTLEAFVRYAADQGVAHRRVGVEELFAKEFQTEFRV